jgi:hypothetical protein
MHNYIYNSSIVEGLTFLAKGEPSLALLGEEIEGEPHLPYR